MPGGPPRDRRPLTRADLPDEFTPDTVRRLDGSIIRRLSQPANGILDADEQRRFDEVLRSVMQDTADRLDRSLHRTRLGGQHDFAQALGAPGRGQRAGDPVRLELSLGDQHRGAWRQGT